VKVFSEGQSFGEVLPIEGVRHNSSLFSKAASIAGKRQEGHILAIGLGFSVKKAA
jgi:hypothetical protein